ncbi:hypothetical protein MITSMUL_05350 [Mitsuokella multacida DSM 20544]|uniref:Uncharacterized protein n=1 Tax=Mitsuokella multacida DSM 20544 TaxID=500635 RepID=C9KQ42_9FIRM|nr:hypothetical protein MITSMUL_05350 [Mitsuokella multacida DSM 20544]
MPYLASLLDEIARLCYNQDHKDTQRSGYALCVSFAISRRCNRSSPFSVHAVYM